MCMFWGEQVEETLNFISHGCRFPFGVFELLNLLIRDEKGVRGGQRVKDVCVCLEEQP